MRVTEKGQVTIPKRLREELNMLGGTEVRFERRGDQLVVRRVEGATRRGDALTARMRGRGDVAMSTDEIMALTRGQQD